MTAHDQNKNSLPFLLLTPQQLLATQQATTLLLDTREYVDFKNAFISGALFIGREGRLAEWAECLIDHSRPIVIIADPGSEDEMYLIISKSGFNIEGVYIEGIEAFTSAGGQCDMIVEIEADELAMDIPFDPNLLSLDVRRTFEFAEGHVQNALNLPLEDMIDIAQIAGIDEHQNINVYSNENYRSTIAVSILKIHGYHNIHLVAGGWQNIKKQSGIPVANTPSALN